MDEVKVTRLDLLSKLRANREAHVKIYNDAMDGYFVSLAKYVKKLEKQVEDRKEIKSVSFDIPRSHVDEYDEAIAMLEMSVDNEIVLNKREFNNYVLDKWISVSEKNLLRTYALSSSNASSYQ